MTIVPGSSLLRKSTTWRLKRAGSSAFSSVSSTGACIIGALWCGWLNGKNGLAVALVAKVLAAAITTTAADPGKGFRRDDNNCDPGRSPGVNGGIGLTRRQGLRLVCQPTRASGTASV